MSPFWLWCLVFATFNLPITLFLVAAPFGKRLTDALREKRPDGTATGATSYSRVTGALGAIAVTSFFWAIGNVVLGLALTDVSRVKPLLDSVGVVFLAGLALFLPYAFNQLKSLFPWTANATVALEPANRGAALQQLPAAGPGGPAPTRLIIGNLSSVTDAELNAVLAAIQIQVSRDFLPEWGVTTILAAQRLMSTQCQVQIDAARDAVIYLGNTVQDPTSGVSGLFGHHALTNPGVPFGFVFLDACAERAQDWSVVLSHEVLELLADPQATARIVGPDPQNPGASNVAFELEVCDATEGDSYTIDSVKVSNFVTQRYFGRTGPSAATNFRGLPLAAFSARPDGYAQYHDSVGVQMLDGNHVSRGQLGARVMMGAARRNARRAAAMS